MRYYFNLTDGVEVFRDEEGLELPNIETALVHATTAIEELRLEDPSAEQEWHGWRLEIVEASGRIVHSLRLEPSSGH